MLETNTAVVDEYYTRYKPDLIAHDESVKQDKTLASNLGRK